MTPPTINEFPPAKQQRLDALLDKNAEGALEAAEKFELEMLVSEAEALMVANARLLADFARGQSPVLQSCKEVAMSIDLPADLAAQIHAQIATGQFQSEEQVLREAFSTLERREASVLHTKTMIREAEDDVAAGHVGTFDRDELKREVRAQLAAQGIVD